MARPKQYKSLHKRTRRLSGLDLTVIQIFRDESSKRKLSQMFSDTLLTIKWLSRQVSQQQKVLTLPGFDWEDEVMEIAFQGQTNQGRAGAKQRRTCGSYLLEISLCVIHQLHQSSSVLSLSSQQSNASCHCQFSLHHHCWPINTTFSKLPS